MQKAKGNHLSTILLHYDMQKAKGNHLSTILLHYDMQKAKGNHLSTILLNYDMQKAKGNHLSTILLHYDMPFHEKPVFRKNSLLHYDVMECFVEKVHVTIGKTSHWRPIGVI